MSALLWNLADVHRQLGDTAPLVEVADRMLALERRRFRANCSATFLQWLIEHKSWDALDAVRRQARRRAFEQVEAAAVSRRRWPGTKQDKTEVAEELAERAVELDAAKPLEGLETAKELEELGQFDWAVREYQPRHRQASRSSRSRRSAPACCCPNLLHDYERVRGSGRRRSNRSSRRCKRIATSAELYAETAQGELAQLGLVAAGSRSARRPGYHFYRACQYRAGARLASASARNCCKAIKFDETDADVLIAMYRVPEADDAWRADTRQRIAEAQPASSSRRSTTIRTIRSPYNQWAWLISNTEGDFQKAVRYSHRSLELDARRIGRPAFSTRWAAATTPPATTKTRSSTSARRSSRVRYMQVMHRQLALFEKALAEKKAGSSEQGQGSASQLTARNSICQPLAV